MGSEVDSAEFDRRTRCLTAALGLDGTQPVSVIRQKIAVLSIDDARHLMQVEQRRADSKVGGKAVKPRATVIQQLQKRVSYLEERAREEAEDNETEAAKTNQLEQTYEAMEWYV